MPVPLIGKSGKPLQIDGSQRAARFSIAPFDIGRNGGAYGVANIIDVSGDGTVSISGTDTAVLSFRWTHASWVALVTRLSLTVSCTAAGAGRGAQALELYKATAFAVNYSTGTAHAAIKKRPWMPDSKVNDLRGRASALTGATVTLSSSPIGVLGWHADQTDAGGGTQANQSPIASQHMIGYPFLLVQNEGLVLRAKYNVSAGFVLSFQMEWLELPATPGETMRGAE